MDGKRRNSIQHSWKNILLLILHLPICLKRPLNHLFISSPIIFSMSVKFCWYTFLNSIAILPISQQRHSSHPLTSFSPLIGSMLQTSACLYENLPLVRIFEIRFGTVILGFHTKKKRIGHQHMLTPYAFCPLLSFLLCLGYYLPFLRMALIV